MNKNTPNNIRLGLFVVAGMVVLVTGLYLIGSKRNIFSNTIRISAVFYNVNGLTDGNNVRYAGIDIGTVDKVLIENDSSVTVYMLIENRSRKYIKKNAIAGIGTDGLMGNKLVNINPVSDPAPPIDEGDVLLSIRPVENEEMVRTLSTTNDNLAAITGDLKKFTGRLNKNTGILKFIEDSVSADNIRIALAAFRDAAMNTNHLTVQLNQLASDLNSGEGLTGVLIKDTSAARQLQATIRNLEMVSDSLTRITSGLNEFATTINNPDGLIYALSKDTAITENVKSSLENINESSELLQEDLKALQRSFLMRKYFREKDREDKKK